MAIRNAARERIIYRTIRSAVLKGQDVEYWAVKMYEQADAGNLTDAHLAELEGLLEAYYDAQDAADEPTEEPTEEPTDA